MKFGYVRTVLSMACRGMIIELLKRSRVGPDHNVHTWWTVIITCPTCNKALVALIDQKNPRVLIFKAIRDYDVDHVCVDENN